MATEIINVPDLECGGCAGSIKRSLAVIDGVSDVTGDPVAKTVTVIYDEQKTNLAELKTAITDAGFSPE